MSSSQARVKEVEGLLNTKEAALITAASARKTLEKTLADMQLHVQEVQTHTFTHNKSNATPSHIHTYGVCVL